MSRKSFLTQELRTKWSSDILRFGHNDVRRILESVTGESVPKEFVSKDELLAIISENQPKNSLAEMATSAMLKFGMAQYQYLLGIRGDNTPDHARYLGYLDVEELYPEIRSTSLETYIKDAFEGRVKTVYS